MANGKQSQASIPLSFKVFPVAYVAFRKDDIVGDVFADIVADKVFGCFRAENIVGDNVCNNVADSVANILCVHTQQKCSRQCRRHRETSHRLLLAISSELSHWSTKNIRQCCEHCRQQCLVV